MALSCVDALPSSPLISSALSQPCRSGVPCLPLRRLVGRFELSTRTEPAGRSDRRHTQYLKTHRASLTWLPRAIGPLPLARYARSWPKSSLRRSITARACAPNTLMSELADSARIPPRSASGAPPPRPCDPWHPGGAAPRLLDADNPLGCQTGLPAGQQVIPSGQASVSSSRFALGVIPPIAEVCQLPANLLNDQPGRVRRQREVTMRLARFLRPVRMCMPSALNPHSVCGPHNGCQQHQP